MKELANEDERCTTELIYGSIDRSRNNMLHMAVHKSRVDLIEHFSDKPIIDLEVWYFTFAYSGINALEYNPKLLYFSCCHLGHKIPAKHI